MNFIRAQTTEQLLLTGGDGRLSLDPHTKLNKYGCTSQPDNELITFASSTGSTISERGFTAARALHQRLLHEDRSAATVYRQELDRIRLTLNQLIHEEVATIFSASGTDLHLVCAQLFAANNTKPLRIVVMDTCENGSGVETAVSGKHFNNSTNSGKSVSASECITGSPTIEISSIKIRDEHGQKRPLTTIDNEVDNIIQQAIANSQRVLLMMIDVSKTGLIAPGPAYVAKLRQQHALQVDVLVDACQFRISLKTLNAYVKLGCMVALTGSKFLTSPIFSGMLLIPPHLIPRLSQQQLPLGLADYSTQAEWPAHWRATEQLSDAPNWGLLFRLEATIAELKSFLAVPELEVKTFLQEFAEAMQQALQSSPHFSPMAEQKLDRRPIYNDESWDQIPTIFPFVLQHQPGKPLTREQTQLIYKQLHTLRYQLGQPVLCGNQHGVNVSALRICASSRLVVEAYEGGEKACRQIIQRALETLKKVEFLINAIN